MTIISQINNNIVFYFKSFQLFESLEGKYWSLFRFPRPLILIRIVRSSLKFRLPKNRINSILQ